MNSRTLSQILTVLKGSDPTDKDRIIDYLTVEHDLAVARESVTTLKYLQENAARALSRLVDGIDGTGDTRTAQ